MVSGWGEYASFGGWCETGIGVGERVDGPNDAVYACPSHAVGTY
jgi:hypothetical protein